MPKNGTQHRKTYNGFFDIGAFDTSTQMNSGGMHAPSVQTSDYGW